VQNGDVVLGDAEATRANVVNGLAHALGEAQAELSGEGESLPFVFGAEGADLTLVATAIAADIDVSAVGGEVKTVQASDARITGFETLNLIAENAVNEGEGANDNDGEAACEISVDFDLISGVEQVNLASEVTLRETVIDEELNGQYVHRSAGDVVTFTLDNLSGELSEAITISGNEVTATGNRQVERIRIDGEATLQEGDVITVTIAGEQYSITVTAEDLSVEDGLQDALNLLNKLAEELGDSGFEVAVDEGEDEAVLTLIGSTEQVEIDLGLTREGEDHDYEH